MSTATARAQRSKQAKKQDVRFLVVSGIPGPRHAPKSAGDVPEDCELAEAQVLEQFDTLEEAIEECRRTNELLMRIGQEENNWNMVVVRF